MTGHGLSMARLDVEERYDRVAELTLCGFNAPEIARKMGVSTRLVQRGRVRRGLAQRRGRPWTPEEVAIAERLLDEGCSYHEVGRTLGRENTSVQGRFPGRSQCTPADGPRIRRMMRELGAV